MLFAVPIAFCPWAPIAHSAQLTAFKERSHARGMSDLSKTAAIQKADRATSALARLRARTKRTAQQVQQLAGMAVGGALAGTIGVHMPPVPGTQILTTDVVSGGLTLVALSGLIDDDQLNDFVLATAGGMIALRAGDAARSFALRPRVQPQR